MQGTVGIGCRLAHPLDEMTLRDVSWNGSVVQLLWEPISNFISKLLQQLCCNIRCSATPQSATCLLGQRSVGVICLIPKFATVEFVRASFGGEVALSNMPNTSSAMLTFHWSRTTGIWNMTAVTTASFSQHLLFQVYPVKTSRPSVSWLRRRFRQARINDLMTLTYVQKSVIETRRSLIQCEQHVVKGLYVACHFVTFEVPDCGLLLFWTSLVSSLLRQLMSRHLWCSLTEASSLVGSQVATLALWRIVWLVTRSSYHKTQET